MTWIVETSVAVKWVVAEDGADLAAPFLSGDVVAPDLLRQELANALWKKVRRDEIGKQQAQLGYGAIIDALRFFPPVILPCGPSISRCRSGSPYRIASISHSPSH
ncbi:type II toxin-antitoxin system VapC family toxin [Sphingomonas sp. RIT328]|uniref:type II toxin-antitoxin system VapC family toxin n=1 Tax=Sphingomonas sp. RIT328 TaxID=1470591 RepID=UPI0006883E39|nr:type II toxin-antitoxin system VapC family toxin [Sphingomonas sp. RIT328]